MNQARNIEPGFLFTNYNSNYIRKPTRFKQENLTFTLQITDYDTRTGHIIIQHRFT
jgi:hypothetical protein